MQTDRLEVRCNHCSHWFESPVTFRSIEAFIDALEEVREANNLVQCEFCWHLTPFINANIRFPQEVEAIVDTIRVA